jgi:hypothetical protein
MVDPHPYHVDQMTVFVFVLAKCYDFHCFLYLFCLLWTFFFWSAMKTMKIRMRPTRGGPLHGDVPAMPAADAAAAAARANSMPCTGYWTINTQSCTS